jgi:hypothetical protein
MSPDLKAIHAYVGTLNSVVDLMRNAVFTSGPINSNRELLETYNATMTRLHQCREAAFVAGVHIGWNPPEMDKEFEWCHDRCREYITNEKKIGPAQAFNVFERDMVHTFRKLDGIIALHKAKHKQAPKESRSELTTNPNDERDKWIYDELNKIERKQTQILSDYKKTAKSRKWSILGSVQALRRAAASYAKRNKLTPPPKRKG